MFIFIISVILVTFISLCFYKGNFWENRYIVLLIVGGVALVATLTTNFIVRGHLQTKTELIRVNPLYTFYFPNSLLKDSLKAPFIKDFHFYSKHKASEFYRDKKDTLHLQRPLTVLIYAVEKDTVLGVFDSSTSQDSYYWGYNKEVYLAKSISDSISYTVKRKLVYDIKPNNWITGFSLPEIKTFTIIYVAGREYKLIPQKYIKKIPY